MLIVINKKKVMRLLICFLGIITMFSLSSYNIKTFKQIVEPHFKGNKENSKHVAIICNVDWGNEYIDSILETLKKENIRITFMVTGRWAEKYPDILLKIKKEGHEIGNHGYKHLDYSKLDYNQNYAEMKKSKEALENIISEKTLFFQPPAGAYNENTLKAAKDIGYIPIKWNIDTIDWKYKDNKDHVVNRIKSKTIEDSSIILMHPTKASSEALHDIIKIINNKGFQVGRLSDVFEVEKIK